MLTRKDLFLVLGIVFFFLPFFIFAEVLEAYRRFNLENGILMSFIKFSILATLGELIGLRIRTGNYHQKGFGILPRMIVWGFLGITIHIAFIIFASGTPVFLEKAGFAEADALLQSGLSWQKALVSLSISVAMNLFYAPVMMTFHRITDLHIMENGGSLRGFVSPIHFAGIFNEINWDVQWNFVFKKTIPLFWIPAHTITFLLPEEFRVLFAALLGIMLGVILAIAALKK